MKNLLLIPLCLLLGQAAQAQAPLSSYLDSNGWYIFLDNEAHLPAQEILNRKAEPGIGNSDSLALSNQQIDNTGGHYRHRRYGICLAECGLSGGLSPSHG